MVKEKFMTEFEIRNLAREYYEPNSKINKTWNPIYIDECKKINRLENSEDDTRKASN